MNGICPMLDRHYGAIPADDCETSWIAVKVDRAGCQINLQEGFETEAEAEEFAGQIHRQDLAEYAVRTGRDISAELFKAKTILGALLTVDTFSQYQISNLVEARASIANAKKHLTEAVGAI
jgi:hypothetical protein